MEWRVNGREGEPREREKEMGRENQMEEGEEVDTEEWERGDG